MTDIALYLWAQQLNVIWEPPWTVRTAWGERCSLQILDHIGTLQGQDVNPLAATWLSWYVLTYRPPELTQLEPKDWWDHLIPIPRLSSPTASVSSQTNESYTTLATTDDVAPLYLVSAQRKQHIRIQLPRLPVPKPWGPDLSVRARLSCYQKYLKQWGVPPLSFILWFGAPHAIIQQTWLEAGTHLPQRKALVEAIITMAKAFQYGVYEPSLPLAQQLGHSYLQDLKAFVTWWQPADRWLLTEELKGTTYTYRGDQYLWLVTDEAGGEQVSDVLQQKQKRIYDAQWLVIINQRRTKRLIPDGHLTLHLRPEARQTRELAWVATCLLDGTLYWKDARSWYRLQQDTIIACGPVLYQTAPYWKELCDRAWLHIYALPN